MFTEFSQIDTPALLIEQTRLERNIDRMQELTNKNGIRLRPHIKTHKMPELALFQLQKGAAGIACAKTTEAEVMARHGISDIQIANIIIGNLKYDRIRKMAEGGINLSCAVDSANAVDFISGFFAGTGLKIGLLVKIDTGFHRSGIAEYQMISSLCRKIDSAPGVRLEGIMSHAGHVYSAQSREHIKIIAEHEASFMAETAEKLRREGFNIATVSVGSTPGAEFIAPVSGITELRAGNYIFYDMIQVALGTTSVENCALSVLATVISTPDHGRAVIDAGSKALGLDLGAHSNSMMSGFGNILGKPGTISRISEEHGIIYNEGGDYKVGEKIRIIPNHACAVVNLHDTAYLTNGSEVIRQIPIEARGKLN